MTEVLVDQPTDRTARKVQAASGGAGLGAMVGLVLGTWSFGYLPADLQAIAAAQETWIAVVTGGVASISAFFTGRRFRERLENMRLT